MKRKDPSLKDLHIIVDEAVHRKIKLNAIENNLTMSEYALRAILNTKIEARLSTRELKLLRDLAALGNNTNQIAKRLNEGQVDKLSAAMAEDVVMKISALLKHFSK